MAGSVSVVVATHNRRDAVLATLATLHALPERPPLIVVDNASTDGTAEAVEAAFPGVAVVRLPRNRGAAGRNAGVARAHTPYVAFADDDSTWAPGALDRAAAHFDACPSVGLLAARLLVGDEHRTDPVCEVMARSPLPRAAGLPGPPVLGFVACGAVVRRCAFLEVGGFSDLLFFLGEERLLAADLAAAGWSAVYVDDVVAHHHPATVSRDPAARRRLQRRNDLLTAWLRRPATRALAFTCRAAADGLSQPATRGGLVDAVRRAPDVLARRQVLPPAVEQGLVLLGA